MDDRPIWPIFVIVCSCIFTVGSAMVWSTSGPTDGATIFVCDGSDVVFDWTFTADTGDQLVDVEWYFQPEGSLTQNTIGGLIHDHFFTDLARVEHVPLGGLKVKRITANDVGHYSVHVNYRNALGFLEHSTSARLQLSVPPVLVDNHLTIRRTPGAVLDSRSGNWSAQLVCGHFESLGNPPVNVEWTTPKGDSLNGTVFESGHFILALPAVSTTGDYSCSIADTSEAISCLTVHQLRPLLSASSLLVDAKDVLVDILQAREVALTHKVEEMTLQMRDMTQRRQQLQSNVTDLSSQIQRLHNSVADLTSQLLQERSSVKALQAQLQQCGTGDGATQAAPTCRHNIPSTAATSSSVWPFLPLGRPCDPDVCDQCAFNSSCLASPSGTNECSCNPNTHYESPLYTCVPKLRISESCNDTSQCPNYSGCHPQTRTCSCYPHTTEVTRCIPNVHV